MLTSHLVLLGLLFINSPIVETETTLSSPVKQPTPNKSSNTHMTHMLRSADCAKQLKSIIKSLANTQTLLVTPRSDGKMDIAIKYDNPFSLKFVWSEGIKSGETVDMDQEVTCVLSVQDGKVTVEEIENVTVPIAVSAGIINTREITYLQQMTIGCDSTGKALLKSTVSYRVLLIRKTREIELTETNLPDSDLVKRMNSDSQAFPFLKKILRALTETSSLKLSRKIDGSFDVKLKTDGKTFIDINRLHGKQKLESVKADPNVSFNVSLDSSGIKLTQIKGLHLKINSLGKAISTEIKTLSLKQNKSGDQLSLQVDDPSATGKSIDISLVLP